MRYPTLAILAVLVTTPALAGQAATAGRSEVQVQGEKSGDQSMRCLVRLAGWDDSMGIAITVEADVGPGRAGLRRADASVYRLHDGKPVPLEGAPVTLEAAGTPVYSVNSQTSLTQEDAVFRRTLPGDLGLLFAYPEHSVVLHTEVDGKVMAFPVDAPLYATEAVALENCRKLVSG